MSDTNRYLVLLARTKKEFPRFNVKKRDESWLRPIFWLLQKVTRQNYDGFVTTIFSTMYVGPDWDNRFPDQKYKSLRHEIVHIDQFHSWPFGRRFWVLNHIMMALAYLFFLPVVFTMRSKFEREGYTQTFLVDYELNGEISEEHMDSNAKWMNRTFGGSTYFFMWWGPSAYKWAMRTQRMINKGKIKNETDRVA